MTMTDIWLVKNRVWVGAITFKRSKSRGWISYVKKSSYHKFVFSSSKVWGCSFKFFFFLFSNSSRFNLKYFVSRILRTLVSLRIVFRFRYFVNSILTIKSNSSIRNGQGLHSRNVRKYKQYILLRIFSDTPFTIIRTKRHFFKRI